MTTLGSWIAPCGIDCARECRIYRGPDDSEIAPEAMNSRAGRCRPAGRPESYRCSGCRGTKGGRWSPACRIRSCCIDRRQLESCGDCGIFPCNPLRAQARRGDLHARGLERLEAWKAGLATFLALICLLGIGIRPSLASPATRGPGAAIAENAPAQETPSGSSHAVPSPPGAGQASNPPGDFPVRFDSEVIHLRIVGDSLEVDGSYFLACRPWKAPKVELIYPYPSDDRLGGARMLSLEGRGRGKPWEPLSFEEIPPAHGARWWIPLGISDTLEVRAVYRQAILGRYARYIVTSTKAWGRPLRKARFEVTLPPATHPVSFSFPFIQETIDGSHVFVFETTDFLPNRDITVEWTAPGDTLPVAPRSEPLESDPDRHERERSEPGQPDHDRPAPGQPDHDRSEPPSTPGR